MIGSQLNSYSGADPIWGFVALIGNERYTGEAVVGIDPRVRLFAVDGRVYFAEREGDAPIGTRLVSAGVLSTAQLEAGVVQIGGTTSVARLFQRQPSIDRDAVELTLELATESLLESVASKAVGMPEVFPLRHHSSGVHHWLRSAIAPTSLTGAETLAAAAPAGESRLIKEGAVEETVAQEVADVAEAVAVEEDSVVAEAVPAEAAIEEAAIEEAAIEEAAIEEAAIEEDSVVAEAAIEEAAIEEAAVEEDSVVAEAAIAEAAIEEAAIEEAAIEVEPALEAIVAEETFAEEVAVLEETVVAESLVVSAPALVLPTLRSFLSPAAEDGHDKATHVEDIQPVDLSDETVPDQTEASIEAAIIPESASEGAPVTHQTLAPIPTLAAPTLPILHTVSASSAMPEPEPETLVTTEPAIASTADEFLASLPEQPQCFPVHPFELVEPPTELPKLPSLPISMSGLLAPSPPPVVTFGEPTHNLAAVDIWEMVDVLTDDRRDSQQELVGSGASDKRGRGWLRGKKG